MSTRVVLFATFFTIFLSISPKSVISVEIGPMIESGDGYGVVPGYKTPTPKSVYKNIIESNEKNIRNFLDFLNKSPANRPTVPTQLTPTVSSSPNSDPYPSDGITPVRTGDFISYKQCDYRHVTMWGGCTICAMGCGITSAAMIIATLKDPSMNPQTIHNLYREKGYQASCSGSYIGDAKSIISSFGIQTSEEWIFRYQDAVEISQVANDIRNYTQNGWYIFALAEFCQNGPPNYGCGHFLIITDIDSQNRITAFDPYYEPGSSISPISYLNRKPYPKFRSAFAVKRT